MDVVTVLYYSSACGSNTCGTCAECDFPISSPFELEAFVCLAPGDTQAVVMHAYALHA